MGKPASVPRIYSGQPLIHIICLNITLGKTAVNVSTGL
jgi:hypothetical protein